MSKGQKKYYTSILFFGILLALLVGCLEFFQYRYFIGRLSTNIYTGVVATLFTVIGIWIGIKTLSPKTVVKEVTKEAEPKTIDHLKIKELNLRDREYEILQLIAEGLSNQEIAQKLFIALPTVKTHISNLYAKLEVRSRTQAIRKAQSLHLI